ncbi:MAG TPA: dihydropteroate synthase, partial [Alphaproteobacteria bacterium]|nr:dihydropteroate synthase [Alphaproteobacteria bacterium]
MKAAPQILGIVNITEDSFSDGGRFLSPEKAVHHAFALMQAGGG